jgi:hypothetical protein
MNRELIDQLGLTIGQVEQIVLEWYLCGMTGDVWQNEYGQDLEEVLEPSVYNNK